MGITAIDTDLWRLKTPVVQEQLACQWQIERGLVSISRRMDRQGWWKETIQGALDWGSTQRTTAIEIGYTELSVPGMTLSENDRGQ